MGRALRVADALEAGMIWLNSENVRHLPTPFGGMKSSGIGRDGGDYSFDFYMETKHVSLARGTHKIQTTGDLELIRRFRGDRIRSMRTPEPSMIPGLVASRPSRNDEQSTEDFNHMPVPTAHLRSAVQHHPLQPRRARRDRPRTPAANSTRPPSACMSRTPTTRRFTCAAARSISITRWCCGKRQLPPAAVSASRSATTAISTRRRASFPKTASPTPSPSSRSRAARCNSPIPPASSSNSMRRWRSARICLRRYDLYKGCHPQRLDHFNVFAAEVQDTVDFYARLGFRLTEYAEEDGPNGRIAAAWMHRKGNVHDFAITNGKWPSPAPFRLLGADRDEHPASVRRDGVQRLSQEHRARPRPPRHFQCVLSLCPGSRRPSPRALHQRLLHRGPRP